MSNPTRIFLAVLSVALAPLMAHAKPAAAPKYATDKPIEITSDALEVQQEQNIAIFTGHVVAIQGDVRLKSEKMTVYYRDQGETGEKKSSDASGQDAIERIVVEGDVFLATPEETASGISGIYDVEHHQIVLDGNVVLTRGNNTLKGTTLVYDFNTGKSMLTGGAVSTLKDGKGKQRVRALLIPEGDEKPAAGKTEVKQEPAKP